MALQLARVHHGAIHVVSKLSGDNYMDLGATAGNLVSGRERTAIPKPF
jgi:hypothetical protein